jgi:hemolysin activation/secretion protein
MVHHKSILWLCLGAVSSLIAAPDAGTISQEIGKQLERTKPLPKAPQSVLPSDTVKHVDTNGVKVAVSAFKISGNSVVSTEDIQSVLIPFIGKKLSFGELQDATRAIVNLYRDRGFSARAFLPPQEVKEGLIEIMILEGKLSAIDIESDGLTRLKSDQGRAIIEAAHPIGSTLETYKLERGLLLLSDLPGVVSAGSLSAGEGAGDSKLKVKLQDAPLFNGSLSYVNSGSKSTGSDQYSLSAGINSPLSIGDQLTLQSMATKGIRYVKGGYSLPVGSSGGRVGGSVSWMSYNVIEGTDADGKSGTLGLYGSYPLIRSPKENLSLSLNLDRKTYYNRSVGTPISDKENNALSLTLSGSKYDDKGQTSYGATLTRGELDLSALQSDYLADQAAAGSNGYFSKLTLNASRTQIINDTTTASLSALVQYANHNLDSGEKMYLGGAYGVRAYPTNEAGGDEGWLINAELNKNFFNGLGGGLFYDIGEIKQHHHLYTNWQGASSAENSYLLKAVGVNMSYNYGTWSAKATVGWKDGKNPNPTTNGMDNDGTNRDPRVWVQLMKTF